MPEPPPLGVGLVGAWPQTPPPPELYANPAAPERWLLGWSQAGELLAAPGCVNLYGTTAAELLEARLAKARELAEADPQLVANIIKEWMGANGS